MQDPILHEFLQRGIKESTIKREKRVLKQYIDFIRIETGQPDLTLSKLLEIAEDDEDTGIRVRRRRTTQYLTMYHEYLQSPQLNYAYNTANRHYNVIKTFYNYYEIVLPKKEPKFTIPRYHETIDDIPSKENIIKAINLSGLKNKAIILLMSTSGMDSITIRQLLLKDLITGVKDQIPYPTTDFDLKKFINHCRSYNNIIPYFEGYRSKTESHEVKYYTFCSPETFTAILDYLEQSPDNVNKPVDLNDFLFPGQKGELMSDQNLQQIFSRINDQLGWGKRGKIRYFHSHGLRKYFANVLEDNQVGGRAFDYLMGHKPHNVKKAYVKSRKERLLVQYKKCLQDFSIEKVRTVDTTPEQVKKLVRESDLKEERIRGLEEKDKMREAQLQRVLEELEKK